MAQHRNDDNQTVEYDEEIKVYVKKKERGNQFIIAIICILVSVLFWCYVNYLEDPIIIKKVTVEFILSENGMYTDVILAKENVEIYGEESVIGSISITNSTIRIPVEKSRFKYSETIEFGFKYPEGIHSHFNKIELTYKVSNEQNNNQ